MTRDIRRKTALVSNRRAHAGLIDQFLERVENFGAVAHRFRECRRADRHDHDFLQIEIVICVRATVDHVHHRHRHLHRARCRPGNDTAANRIHRQQPSRLQATPRASRWLRVATCFRYRRAQSTRPSRNACSFASRPMMASEISVLMFSTAFSTPFPAVAAGVQVAQLNGLARAGRCTRWHRSAAPSRRFRAARRIQRWDCHANPGSHGR